MRYEYDELEFTLTTTPEEQTGAEKVIGAINKTTGQIKQFSSDVKETMDAINELVDAISMLIDIWNEFVQDQMINSIVVSKIELTPAELKSKINKAIQDCTMYDTEFMGAKTFVLYNNVRCNHTQFIADYVMPKHKVKSTGKNILFIYRAVFHNPVPPPPLPFWPDGTFDTNFILDKNNVAKAIVEVGLGVDEVLAIGMYVSAMQTDTTKDQWIQRVQDTIKPEELTASIVPTSGFGTASSTTYLVIGLLAIVLIFFAMKKK